MLRALAGAFDKAAGFACGVLVAALLACVSLGALTRTLGDPLIWTDELSRFLMVWLAVLGWVVASRKRLHVRIRFIQDRLPAQVHKAAEIAIQVAMTLFGALVTWYSIGLIGKNHDLLATSMPISMAWMYVPMLLAGVVTALHGVSELIATLRPRRLRVAGTEAAVE
jgi:TRAP-type transport system small permease protein